MPLNVFYASYSPSLPRKPRDDRRRPLASVNASVQTEPGSDLTAAGLLSVGVATSTGAAIANLKLIECPALDQVVQRYQWA